MTSLYMRLTKSYIYDNTIKEHSESVCGPQKNGPQAHAARVPAFGPHCINKIFQLLHTEIFLR